MMTTVRNLRKMELICRELAHYMEMEEEYLRTMYFAGRRGEEIKQEWKDGQKHAAAMVKDYRAQLRDVLKEFPR